MKIRKLITAVIAFLAFAVNNMQAQTLPSYVPTNGLVGYWGFNGTANDQSGNGNNGSFTGSSCDICGNSLVTVPPILSSDRFNNSNSAFQFTNQLDLISIPNNNLLQLTTPYTISIWLNPSTFDFGNYTWGVILAKWGGAGSASYQLRITNTGKLTFDTHDGTNTTSITSNSSIQLNSWTHLQINQINSNVSISINNSIDVYSSNMVIPSIVNNTIEIGRNYNQFSNYAFEGFVGKIDDIAIYNRALTQAEITQLYTSTSSTQNLCTKTTQPYNVNVGDATHDGSTYAWSITPTAPNAVIAGNGTNEITIDWTNVPDGSYTLQAVETSIEGCVSTAVTATINLSATPTPIAQPQTFCTTATVANLVATGTDIKWYASANDGAALETTTILTTGTYYASQTVNGCESTRTAVNVTVNETQITASANTVCSGTAVTITASANSATSAGASTLPANLQNGLVGYWPFNGNANDESGNNNNGTVNGATLTTDRFGNSNGAYSFDGINNSIQSSNPYELPLSNNSRTISSWLEINGSFNINNLGNNNNGLGSIFEYGNFNNSQRYGLLITPDNYIYIVSNDNDIATNIHIPENQWLNVVVTYSNNSCLIYLNSNLAYQGSFSSLLNTGDNFFSIGNTISDPLGLGQNEAFNGKIDDISIYNRVLSPSEISQLYNQGQTSYLWSTGETTATINPTPTETTTYWCDVTANGVTCRKEMTITVTPQTTPAFNPIAAICSGAVIDALPTTSINGVTGTWSPEVNNLATTEYTFTPDAAQCAAQAIQTIVVNPGTTTTTTINTFDTYTWAVNGVAYTNSGTYTYVNECQTEILNLTIAPAVTSEVSVSVCGDSYTWSENGTIYYESGDYTNVVGNTIAILHLTITPTTQTEVRVAACGDTYFWNVNNTEYPISGDYTYTVDCHTDILHLSLTPETQSEVTIAACGDTYVWDTNAIQYTQSGDYTNTVNCHTDILHLTLTPVTQTEVTVAACGDTFTWESNQLQYTQSGDYTNSVNCSTEMLHLTLTPATQSEDTVAACGDSYLWEVNGTQYTQSGQYINTVNCHTDILHLTLTPATQTEVSVAACGDSYTWIANDTQYTQSGDYTLEVNCHTDILHLTLTPRVNTTTTIAACDSYFWTVDGTTYTTSGNYTFETECTIENLVLTINSNAITTQPTSASICKATGATATLSVATAADAATYKWYTQAATGTTWTLISNNANYSGTTTANLTITKTNTILPASGTKYKVEITSYCGVKTSDVVTITDLITVSKATAISVVGTLSPLLTTCQGTSVNVALAAGSIGNIQWQASADGITYANVGDVVAQTALSASNPLLTFNTGVLTQTTWFRAVASNGVCSAATATAIKVTVSQPASVGTLTPLASTVCTGSGTTLNLNNATGSIVWYKSTNFNATTPIWSAVAGATSATLNTGILTYSASVPMVWYKAIATNGACKDYSDSASVSISAAAKATTISVVGTLSPALTTCQGSSVNLALAAGSIGNIQWRSSTDGMNYENVGSVIAATSAAANPSMAFNTGVLSQTTWFQAVLTNNSCTAMATPIKITVSAPVNAGSIAGGDVTVCAYAPTGLDLNGAPASFSNSTLLSVEGATGTIKWQKSLNYVNTTGATPIWINETSTTDQLTATNLTVDTWYRVVVTNGACVAMATPVKITVSKAAVAGSISATANGAATTSVCAAGDITFTSTAFVGSAIQWEVSTVSATTGFQAIAGANQLTFTMTGVAYAPSSTFYVRSVVTSGNCSIARSAVKAIKVNPQSVAGVASGARAICSGSNAKVLVVGATGSIQWQSSADGVNFTNVPTGLATAGTNYVSGSSTATTATYLVTNVTADSYFRAKVTSGVCSVVYTNAVALNITTAAVSGSITGLSPMVCSGTGTTLTLTGALGSIQWQKSTSLTGVYVNINGATANTLATGNITVATAYRAVVTIGSCSTVIADPVLVSVYSAPLAKTITANTTTPSGATAVLALCASTNKMLTIAAGSNGAIQWQHSTTSTTTGFMDIAGETATTYTVTNPAIGVNYYRARFTNACGVSVNGVAFTLHYKDCAIAKEVESTEVNLPFAVIASPNPFTTSCNLNITTSSTEIVQVRIYDMIGKLIDKTEVTPSAINDLQLGTNYPTGVYNVIVSQGDNVKTVRVIKR